MNDLTQGLLNLNLTPEQGRLLDRQSREQQIQQQSRGAPAPFQGMMAQTRRTADTMQNLGRAAFGGRGPVGPAELQAQQAQQMQQAQLAKQQKDLQVLKGQAENALYQQKDISPQAVSAMLKNIQTDTTGEFSKKVLDRYGIPKPTDPTERYKVAGNKVFDTKTRSFIEDPLTSKDTNKTIQVNLKKETGLDPDSFTKESWKAANDVMIDPDTPLAERLTSARKLLVLKDQEMNPELEEYLVKQLETYDPKGLENRFNVINEQMNILNQGILSGFGANALTTLATVGQRFGILSPEQQQTLANTQTFDSNAGNLVAEVIKAFGAGTGLSDADREYATKIAGGLISLEELSLKKILDITQRRAIAEAELYNKQLAKLGDDWMAQAIEPPRFRRMTLKEDPYIQQVDMDDGTIMYIDTNPDGYTNEVYDANGYLVK
jgi:hypothetical protein